MISKRFINTSSMLVLSESMESTHFVQFTRVLFCLKIEIVCYIAQHLGLASISWQRKILHALPLSKQMMFVLLAILPG
jgi:hypothetical protein